MGMISKGKAAFGGRIAKVNLGGIRLSISLASIAENSPALSVIGTLAVAGGIGPFTFSIQSDPDAKFAIGGAGSNQLLLRSGASLNYEAKAAHQVTILVVDAGDGDAEHAKTLSVQVLDVADGPTTTGAASTINAKIGSPASGTPIVFDAREIIVSPSGQPLLFDTSFGGFGTVDADGYTVRWTPQPSDVAASPLTFTLRAIDQDGQTASVTSSPFSVAAVNLAPLGGGVDTVSEVPADETAPVLSSPLGTQTGSSTATGGVTSTEAVGTIYMVTTIYANQPTAMQIMAGQNHLGVPAAFAATDTTPSAGANPFSISTLQGSTNYWNHYVQVDRAGNVSNIVSSAQFTTTAAPTAPAKFAGAGWSVVDAGTNGDVTLTVITLPSNGGSAITALEYQIDGGSWVSLGGTTTGAYTVSGLTDAQSYSFSLRAVNAIGNGVAADAKTATPTGVPTAFTAGQWSVANDATGGDATLTITALPAANGSTITGLQVKIGAAAYTSLGAATTGVYPLVDLFTDGVATNVLIRAVNANGNGPDSDTKSVTTSPPATNITGHDTPQFFKSTAQQQSFPSLGTVTGVEVGDKVIVHLHGLGNGTVMNGTLFTATLNGAAMALEATSWFNSATVLPGSAAFSIEATAAGSLSIAADLGASARACLAVVWVLKGADAADPVGQTFGPNSNGTAVTSQALPPSGVTTAANRNVVLASVDVKGDVSASLALTGFDGTAMDKTGTSSTSDITVGAGWKTTDPAALVSGNATWTGAVQSTALITEIKKG